MNEKVRMLAFQLSNGYCMCSEDCTEKADQLHHTLANTKINKKKFPLFVDSIFNLCPINSGCHLTKPVPRIREQQAILYEQYLQMLKDGEI